MSPSVQQAAQACQANEILTDFGCLPNNPVSFMSRMYGIGLGLLALIVIVYIIWGGYYIMTSRGNPEQLQKGRSYIFNAILGLLLGIFGFVFIQVVTSDILKIPGFF